MKIALRPLTCLALCAVVFLAILTSCAPDPSSLHNPANDLGVTDEDIDTRLNMVLVGESPDGDNNPLNLCGEGVMLKMEDDPYCGYVDIGKFLVEEINRYRAMHDLPPFVRAYEHELCAAREARLALENDKHHYSDGCGWRSQGAAGGGRGGDGSAGTVQKSVAWVPKLFYQEGPDGGHYQAMMTDRSRFVTGGYYAIDRDKHRIVVNYYDEL